MANSSTRTFAPLHYITKNIAVFLPNDEKEALKAIELLKQKHNGHYKCFDVSARDVERTRTAALLDAADLRWPAKHTAHLDRFCAICKEMHIFLSAHDENLVLLYAEGVPEHAAVIIAAYIHYSAISSQTQTIEDRQAMQSFVNRFQCSPSSVRYVRYFANLLNGYVQLNASPLYLNQLVVYKTTSSSIILELFEKYSTVFESRISPESDLDLNKFELGENELKDLRVRGDVLIKCFVESSAKRVSLFSCQFNTCAVELNNGHCQLSFAKEDLDNVQAGIEETLELRVNLSTSGRSSLSRDTDSSNTKHSNSSTPKNAVNEVEYSEIRKEKPTAKLETMGPPVAPKPRPASAASEPIQEQPERRAVLPKQVRPPTHRPPSPREGRATPSIEPDLVSKDRYDKASRCFSYAPAKELSQAFERPRRPSLSRTIERKEDDVEQVPSVLPHVELQSTQLTRRPESPKWHEQVDDTQETLLRELRDSCADVRFGSKSNNYADGSNEERAMVVEQAQRASTGTLPRERKHEKTRDDSAFSDMDHFCDPNFYLNYTEAPNRSVASKSAELPRKRYGRLDEFEPSPLKATDSTSCSDLRDKEEFRKRNCTSVAAVPSRERLTYNGNGARHEADEWLNTKLRKVKSKRNVDTHVARNRTHEQLLLEELKNSYDTNEEKESCVDGDVLTDYQREEQRLHNTHTPYDQRRDRMHSKPPTPPPRDRSRSPQNNGFEYQNGDENFDISSLHSYGHKTMTNGRSSRRNNDQPPFNYQDTLSRPGTPTRYLSGQERVAAAITRAETPQRELNERALRAETPNRYYPENAMHTLQRSGTPSFPRETPVPFHPLLYGDESRSNNYNSMSRPRQLGRHSASLSSLDNSQIIHQHPMFMKDTSRLWYKPRISREQAIAMLRDKAAGSFVVRDSNSFPGAFGLALKVATPPPGVAVGDGTELVRHFLIEPSPKGVKLKGCNNEPVFGSLCALVYQHSITPLALPEKLLLPEYDAALTPEHVSATQALLEQGAACNVAYLGSEDCESMTGSECVRRAVANALKNSIKTAPVSVHFKVSSQGITLTDNTRKVFFRWHFPVSAIIFAALDPQDRRMDNTGVIGYHESCVKNAKLFAFVARKASSSSNICHVFSELESDQPATAVVNFLNRVLL